jgi:hypothetical protein
MPEMSHKDSSATHVSMGALTCGLAGKRQIFSLAPKFELSYPRNNDHYHHHHLRHHHHHRRMNESEANKKRLSN